MAAGCPYHSVSLRANVAGSICVSLSAAGSTFKFDMGSEKREGQQDSTISVFTLRDGKPRHFYTAHPWMSPDVKERGIDLLNPIWSYFDLTPQGRGDFYTKVDYPARS